MNAIGRDAARAATLATAQVERADKMFADFAARVDQTMTSVQESIGGPAREGRALLSAFRAAFQALREMRQAPRSRQGRGEETRSASEDDLLMALKRPLGYSHPLCA